MLAREKTKWLRKLDEEMKPFRRAARETNATDGLLRAVRTVLRIPIDEVAKAMGTSRSVICDMERRELTNSITMKSMSRMAEAMGCKLVYGIVPRDDKTLERLLEERWWKKELVGNRE